MGPTADLFLGHLPVDEEEHSFGHGHLRYAARELDTDGAYAVGDLVPDRLEADPTFVVDRRPRPAVAAASLNPQPILEGAVDFDRVRRLSVDDHHRSANFEVGR